MALYFSKSLGGGFRMGVSLFGGSGGRRRETSSAKTVDPSAIAEAEDEALLNDCVAAVEAVNTGSSVEARQAKCREAISLLRRIRGKSHLAVRVKNGRALLAKLEALENVLPLHPLLEKAERAEFKGERKQALSACLDAIYYCRKHKVTDTMLAAAGVRDTEAGGAMTLSRLEEIARVLGWSPDSGTAADAPKRSEFLECPACGRCLYFSDFAFGAGGEGKCPMCQTQVVLA